MSQAIAIVGESGSGKTSSLAQVPELGIEGLDPKETFIINVKGKPLPIKGFRSKYVPVQAGGPPDTGNYLSTTDTDLIIRTMNFISSSRPDIKNVVLDDGQYIMSEEFMANALKSGYDKFNRMAKNMYDVINTGINMSEDKNFILLTHVEVEEGKAKIKTLGEQFAQVKPI